MAESQGDAQAPARRSLLGGLFKGFVWIGRGLIALLWLVLRGFGAVGRALYRSPAVHAMADLLRQGLVRLAEWAWAVAARFSAWLHRRFGRPITIALTGFAFLAVALAPEGSMLYQGIDWAGDHDCLAMNIYHEARNEPDEGKLAVGYVVMNRVSDSRFPDTVCDVVMQGGQEPLNQCQFSWWCDGREDAPRNGKAWVESQFFADRIFAGDVGDPTGGALWYHADYVEPAWGKRLLEGPKIGAHKFYLSN